MTRLDQIFAHLNRHVTKLHQKYADFSNGVVEAILEEEMKIRREETEVRALASQQREQSPGA
jgi:hypothetical protein